MSSFRIISGPIDLAGLRDGLANPACGAYVQFEGWVRDHNEGRRVRSLEYEVHEAIALKEGRRIVAEAIERFGLRGAAAVHRSGPLKLTDVAVAVGAASDHRSEAFDACRYMIDQLKVRLPIWKKEHYADGTSEWVNCQRCAEAGHQHAV